MTEKHTNSAVQIKRTSRFFWGFFFLLLISLLTSCQSLSFGKRSSRINEPKSEYIPDFFEWTAICPGIKSCTFENPSFPLRYIIVEIDLKSNDSMSNSTECDSPGLMIQTWPDPQSFRHKYSPLPRKSIEDFAREKSCVVAWNTCPFELWKSTGATIEGVYKKDGKILSEAMEKYAMLLIRKCGDGSGYEAFISETQDEKATEDWDIAIGGFYMTLSDGEPCGTFRKTNDSRTAVGLSEDGRIMYVLSVEGENEKSSEGLSYEQCNEIFMALGCGSAIQFDGGGSTNLFLDGERALSYPEERFSPCYMGVLRVER